MSSRAKNRCVGTAGILAILLPAAATEIGRAHV